MAAIFNAQPMPFDVETPVTGLYRNSENSGKSRCPQGASTASPFDVGATNKDLGERQELMYQSGVRHFGISELAGSRLTSP